MLILLLPSIFILTYEWKKQFFSSFVRSSANKTKKCSLFYFVRVLSLINSFTKRKRRKKKEMSRTFDTLCLFIYLSSILFHCFFFFHICNNQKYIWYLKVFIEKNIFNADIWSFFTYDDCKTMKIFFCSCLFPEINLAIGYGVLFLDIQVYSLHSFFFFFQLIVTWIKGLATLDYIHIVHYCKHVLLSDDIFSSLFNPTFFFLVFRLFFWL
jgi:hypothetical protein